MPSLLLALSLTLPRAVASPCDAALFGLVAPPEPDADRIGVAFGRSTLEGRSAVGARFLFASTVEADAWERILRAAEVQDEWVPRRFGYDQVERIDPTHMYLRFDIGLLFGSVHVRRQLVVEVVDERETGHYRTCWRMIDPAPWRDRIAAWVRPDVDWEVASAGWWSVEPTPDGGARVGYQWWTQEGQIPPAVQQFGVKHSIPDLLVAFEARAAEVAAGRTR